MKIATCLFFLVVIFDKICSDAGKVELNRDHMIYFILCIICGCLTFTLVRSLRLQRLHV